MTPTPTTPPTRNQIEDWCNRSGLLTELASRSFVPGQGLDMQVIVAGHTLETGGHVFIPYPGAGMDPTTNKYVAAQLNELSQHGALNIVGFHMREPIRNITAAEAAAGDEYQRRINDRSKWAIV